MHAIVVGAGFGGIAAALRLRAKGYEVTLIDRCNHIGGRARVFEREGFRHDAGPTVITAPFLFEELFALFNEKFSDHVRLVPLTPWYRFAFRDGSRFDYGGTLEQTLAEIRRIEPRDVEGYLALLRHSQRIFDVGFTQLSAQPFHRLWTMLRQIPSLLRLRSHETVWQMVSRFLCSPKLRRAFSIQPLLVGGNPFDTTSIYGLIHYLERAYGVHFAMGGTGAITRALEDLMRRQGVRILLDTTVSALQVSGKRAEAVILADGTVMAADVIVSNADPAFLYRQMIPHRKQSLPVRAKLAAAEYSMGLYVLYFGTTRSYPEVVHHTIWMGERYRVAALGETLLPGLEQSITAEFAMTPEDFKEDYLSEQGAGFSIAPIFRQSAWFRFHNRAEGIRNLYLVGAGTHPGAGVPGVLCSAKAVDALIAPAADV